MINIAVISSGRCTSFFNSLALIPEICSGINLQVFSPSLGQLPPELSYLHNFSHTPIACKPSIEQYQTIAQTIDRTTSAVLVYSKNLIPSCIYQAFTSINFHPSVLPYYPGLNGKSDALLNNHLGFTAHIIDQSIDLGPRLITFQISPFPLFDNLYLETLSFRMCSILTAVIIKRLKFKNLDFCNCQQYVACSIDQLVLMAL